MKKIILSAAIVVASLAGVSQENYTIKMTMKIEGLPPEYAGFGEQETITYIKGKKTRTEVSSMMMNMVSVSDGKTTTALTEAMGNKTGYTVTEEELAAAEKANKSEKPKVEYTNEKKAIAGYECTKAIVTATGKDKKEEKITVWLTEAIKADVSRAAQPKNGGIAHADFKGYPLEIEMNSNQGGMDMTIKITTTEVNTSPIEDSMFSISTEGYKMTSYKDFMSKMGQGR